MACLNLRDILPVSPPWKGLVLCLWVGTLRCLFRCIRTGVPDTSPVRGRVLRIQGYRTMRPPVHSKDPCAAPLTHLLSCALLIPCEAGPVWRPAQAGGSGEGLVGLAGAPNCTRGWVVHMGHPAMCPVYQGAREARAFCTRGSPGPLLRGSPGEQESAPGHTATWWWWQRLVFTPPLPQTPPSLGDRMLQDPGGTPGLLTSPSSLVSRVPAFRAAASGVGSSQWKIVPFRLLGAVGLPRCL